MVLQQPQTYIDPMSTQSLRLGGMARQYEAVLQLPAHQHPDAHTLIATLADAEHLHRNHAKIQLYLRLGKLRYPGRYEMTLTSVSPLDNRRTLSAIVACRRRMVPLVQPLMCGVMTTFVNS